jgi:hypothetical protein
MNNQLLASNIKQLVFPETVILKNGLNIKVFRGKKKHFGTDDSETAKNYVPRRFNDKFFTVLAQGSVATAVNMSVISTAVNGSSIKGNEVRYAMMNN